MDKDSVSIQKRLQTEVESYQSVQKGKSICLMFLTTSNK